MIWDKYVTSGASKVPSRRFLPAGHPDAVFVPDYFEPRKGAYMEREVEVNRSGTTVYVVGLAFSELRDRVVLIKKKRGPQMLIGKWNGVGGHVEPGEAPDEAMRREFEEETGIGRGEQGTWDHFLTLRGAGWEVHFFHMFSNDAVLRARTTEDETVGPHYVQGLPNNVAPNLRWIIPMALGHLDEHVVRYNVLEAEVTETVPST